MPAFDFRVKVEAVNIDEARRVLSSMFDIMKTVRDETSTTEFIEFAEKLKAQPSLVKTAQMFI
jgi:hypothetical protein